MTLVLALMTSAPAMASSGWRPLDPDNALVIETSAGQIVVQMHPELAPLSVARVKRLARERVYDGLLFHRVIDHFVDQTGNPNNHDGGVSAYSDLPPEFQARLPAAALDNVALRNADGIGGFIGALPVMGVPAHGHPGQFRMWGAYCAGVAGMGRQANPDTGNSEIFFMRDASRVLDHDYAVWGVVVSGLEVVRKVAVGEPPAHPDRMTRVRVMAELAPAARPRLEVMDVQGRAFRALVAQARAAEGADFSVCDVPVPVRAVPVRAVPARAVP